MFTNKTILIVDDEEKSRLYLAELTHELFPELTLQFASSPIEAMFILEKQKIDLIFLDVEMPGMTGLDLLTQLREKIVKTPVVFVSAYKRAEFIQKALRLNAIDYIDKPVDPEELQLAIVKAFTSSIDSETSTLPTQKTGKKLNLHTANGVMLFEPDDIMYFESKKREAIAHFVNGFTDVIVRCNLKALSDLFPESSFIRVSRQYIINKQFVKFISQSNHTITLSDGSNKIVLERIYPDVFKSRMLM